jgi:hypothetical protein
VSTVGASVPTVGVDYVGDESGAFKTASLDLAANETRSVSLAGLGDHPPEVDLRASVSSADTLAFDASASSDLDGTIASYEWDFDGDGIVDATTTTPTTAHTYSPTIDSVMPTVRVIDDGGASRSQAAGPFAIVDGAYHAPVHLDISPAVGSAPLATALQVTGFTGSDFAWDFGDGTLARTSSPATTHSFAAGNYSVTVWPAGNPSAQVAADVFAKPPPSGPTAADDVAEVTTRSAVDINPTVNDTDPDDDLVRTDVTIVDGPSRGTISRNRDDTLSYAPTGLNSGQDSFRYEVCDTTARCATATVHVSIIGDSLAPASTATVGGASPSTGWYRNPITLDLQAVDEVGGSGVASITYVATGAQSIASTTVTGSSASVPVSAQGTTTVTFFATDAAGNTETADSVDIRVDTLAPTITVTSPAQGATYTPGQQVVAAYSCNDAQPGCTATGTVANGAPLDTTVGSHSITVNAVDVAGNAATPTVVTYTVAAPPPPSKADSVAFLFSGSTDYCACATLTSGDLRVVTDKNGVVSITGSGTIPGKNGGSAKLTVDIVKLRTGFYVGYISVNDPNFGRSGFHAVALVAGSVKALTANTASGHAAGIQTWFPVRTVQLAWTITDASS